MVSPHKPDERSVRRRHDGVSPNAAIPAVELHDGEISVCWSGSREAECQRGQCAGRRRRQRTRINTGRRRRAGWDPSSLSSSHSGSAGAKVAKSLGRLILPLLPTTTYVSRHLLRQAANGLFGRAVHELLSALIGDQPRQRLAETVRRILETGATSGADTCEGLLAFAPTFLVPRDTRVVA